MITARVRKLAIDICEAAANSGDSDELPLYRVLAERMGLRGNVLAPARSLAVDAWDYVYERSGHRWTRHVDLVAATILRDGWSPGDEIEVLP